ncbi:MAG: hypothetical protein IJA61_02650 [Clostridia bacterium]|nr:hypothetical protein [Clostridia bacterium]
MNLNIKNKRDAIEQIKKEEQKRNMALKISAICVGMSIVCFANALEYTYNFSGKMDNETTAIVEKYENSTEYVDFKDEKIDALNKAMSENSITTKGYNAEKEYIESRSQVLAHMEKNSPDTYTEYSRLQEISEDRAIKGLIDLGSAFMCGLGGAIASSVVDKKKKNITKKKRQFKEEYGTTFEEAEME